MIRVLHIIDSLGIGGTQPMLVGLCNHKLNIQNNIKHKVLSLHGLGNEHFFDSLKENNVEVINLAGSKYNVVWIFARLLYYLSKKRSYDLIHLHLRASTLIGSVIKSLFMLKKPVVTGVYEQKNQLSQSYTFFSKFRSQINIYIAMSDADKDDLVSTGIPGEKIVTILPLVDIEGSNDDQIRSRQYLNSEYKIPPGHLILMSVARLHKDRKIQKIFEILPGILARGLKAILIVVGDGPEKEKLVDYSRKIGIENNIIWAGTRYDIWNILPGCDVYLSASADCLISLAAIEAMACSRPVVTYNINSMPEPEMICQSRGYFITTRDKESFTDVVCRFLENEELRKEYGMKAKEKVNNDISINKDTSVRKYIEMYEKLLVF
jgi:L-malate glycosyltransferase